jgi:hypothetical protein
MLQAALSTARQGYAKHDTGRGRAAVACDAQLAITGESFIATQAARMLDSVTHTKRLVLTEITNRTAVRTCNFEDLRRGNWPAS